MIYNFAYKNDKDLLLKLDSGVDTEILINEFSDFDSLKDVLIAALHLLIFKTGDICLFNIDDNNDGEPDPEEEPHEVSNEEEKEQLYEMLLIKLENNMSYETFFNICEDNGRFFYDKWMIEFIITRY